MPRNGAGSSTRYDAFTDPVRPVFIPPPVARAHTRPCSGRRASIMNERGKPLSGSKNIIAPAAVACALGASIVPTAADAKKKIDCDEFKPDTTLSSSTETAVSGAANSLVASGETSAEAAKSETKKEISDEQLAADTKLYNSCLAYQKGMIDEDTWKAAFMAYQGITPAPQAPAQQQPAQQPQQQQPQQQPQQVVVVQQAAPGQAAAPQQGGGGKGKAILIGVLAVVVIVGVIMIARAAGGGSDDAGDDGGTTATSSATTF